MLAAMTFVCATMPDGSNVFGEALGRACGGLAVCRGCGARCEVRTDGSWERRARGVGMRERVACDPLGCAARMRPAREHGAWRVWAVRRGEHGGRGACGPQERAAVAFQGRAVYGRLVTCVFAHCCRVFHVKHSFVSFDLHEEGSRLRCDRQLTRSVIEAVGWRGITGRASAFASADRSAPCSVCPAGTRRVRSSGIAIVSFPSRLNRSDRPAPSLSWCHGCFNRPVVPHGDRSNCPVAPWLSSAAC